jgi:hypothetical protein
MPGRATEFVKRVAGLLPYPAGLALLDAAVLALRPDTRKTARRTRAILCALGTPRHVLGGPFAGMNFEWTFHKPTLWTTRPSVWPPTKGRRTVMHWLWCEPRTA